MYNATTRRTETPAGVTTRVPGFGDPARVEWLDPSQASPGAYFKDIGNMLVELGFSRNGSLRGAPYDFRRAPSEYFCLSEAVALMNPMVAIDLLASKFWSFL